MKKKNLIRNYSLAIGVFAVATFLYLENKNIITLVGVLYGCITLLVLQKKPKIGIIMILAPELFLLVVMIIRLILVI